MRIASQATDVGTELPPFSMALSPEKFDRWYVSQSTAEVANIHGRGDIAKREGLPGRVASAPDVAELMMQSLVMFFGEGWFVGGRASITVARPVFEGDFLTAKGRVVAKTEEGERVRLECEVWVENQRGERKLTGTASGLI